MKKRFISCIFFASIILILILIFNFFSKNNIVAIFDSDGNYETVEATVSKIEKIEDSESSDIDYDVYVKYESGGSEYEIKYVTVAKLEYYEIGKKFEINVSSKYPHSTVSSIISGYEKIFIVLNVILIFFSLIDSSNNVEKMLVEFNSEKIVKSLRKKKIISVCSSVFFAAVVLAFNLLNEKIIQFFCLDSYYKVKNLKYHNLMPVFLTLSLLVLLLKIYRLNRLKDNNLKIITAVCKKKKMTKYEDSEGSVTKNYHVIYGKNNADSEVSEKFYNGIIVGNKIGTILYKNKISKPLFICKYEQGYADNFDFDLNNKNSQQIIDSDIVLSEELKIKKKKAQTDTVKENLKPEIKEEKIKIKEDKYEKVESVFIPQKSYSGYVYNEDVKNIRSKIKKKSKIHTAGFSVFYILPILFIVMIAFINNKLTPFGILFMFIIAASVLLIIGKQKLTEEEKETYELSFFEKLSSEEKRSIYNKGTKAFFYKILSFILNYSIIFLIVAMAEVSDKASSIIFLFMPLVLICSVVFFINYCCIINNKLFDIYAYKKIKKERKQNKTDF